MLERKLYPRSVSLVCPLCTNETHAEIEVAAFRLTADNPSDRIGRSLTHIKCVVCSSPLSIAAQNHGNFIIALVVDHPDVAVYLDDASTEYEDFLQDYIPSDPIWIFRRGVNDLVDLTAQIPEQVLNDPMYDRMLFLQWMGMMEAYLADRIIGIALNDPAIIVALVGATGLSGNKVSLIDVAKDPDLVLKNVKAYLQHVTYHDVEKVDRLYRAVFRDGIYSEDKREYFLRMAEIRHDCVHRNGRDKDGNLISMPRSEVERFGQLVVGLVEETDAKYRRYITAPPSV